MCSLLHLRSLGPLAIAAVIINHAHGATAPSGCEQVLSGVGIRLVDARCTESADLTTSNPATTPANDSIASLPAFAFTPQIDRETIAPDPPHRTPIVAPVPGIQIEARIADDPQGQARILIRLPDNWNGRLVVAGAPGTRSEFSSDFAWSDYVVQKGYAYVSQNKGTLNFRASNAEDATACRTNSPQVPFVHFYDDDPGMPFTRWAIFMAEAARLGRNAVQIHYGREARYTYAVGTSNGGYQVRRAVESYPELFDGGVDWEGTFVDAGIPNLLSTLPPAILNYRDYVASGFNPNSTAARNILAAGYPPDLTIVKDGKISSLWGLHYLFYWEVTMCQWQKRLDPGYNTYGPGLANYVYLNRVSASNVAETSQPSVPAAVSGVRLSRSPGQWMRYCRLTPMRVRMRAVWLAQRKRMRPKKLQPTVSMRCRTATISRRTSLRFRSSSSFSLTHSKPLICWSVLSRTIPNCHRVNASQGVVRLRRALCNRGIAATCWSRNRRGDPSSRRGLAEGRADTGGQQRPSTESVVPKAAGSRPRTTGSGPWQLSITTTLIPK